MRGGPGTCYLGKTFWILYSSKVPFAGLSNFSDRILARFQAYGLENLLLVLKSLTVLRKTVETVLDLHLAMLIFMIFDSELSLPRLIV